MKTPFFIQTVESLALALAAFGTSSQTQPAKPLP